MSLRLWAQSVLDVFFMLCLGVLRQEVTLLYQVCLQINFELLFILDLIVFADLCLDKLVYKGLSLGDVLVQDSEQFIVILGVKFVFSFHHGVCGYKISLVVQELVVSLILLFLGSGLRLFLG